MVALYTANGSGTKLYQGFIDGHPEVYMVPAYPLMYFYAHWEEWSSEMPTDRTWADIIDVFCVKHASVIDTRRISGFDGLAELGDDRSEFIAIDEAVFRSYLAHLLANEAISGRTFLLAVHYAYAYCRNENLKLKTVLVYHIHVHEYLPQYLIPDFPELLIIGTVRDPRSNFSGRYNSSEVAVDAHRYDATDAAIFKRRVYYFISRYLYESLEVLSGVSEDRLRVVRHEDLFYDAPAVLRKTAAFIGISEHPCLSQITFGGQLWWGDQIYDMEPMNTVNPRIVSESWKKKIGRRDWYVFEGLFRNYMRKYGYEPELYTANGWIERIRLYLTMLLPSTVEWGVFIDYLRPTSFAKFIRACCDEASGRTPFKDYGFNAFYRHKWTQKDLRIWRPRRYREYLKKCLQNREVSRGLGAFISLRIAQTVFVAINLIRYVTAIISCPVYLVRRWRVTAGRFWRAARHDEILPDTLP
tara:strand:+ start:7678 stop:9087 length:1410 start_codon:yes stop_codon:yes gene_type:complete